MKIYKVVAPVTISQGVMLLTDDQTRPRLHCLEKTSRKGTYAVLQKVTFKAGEVIGLEQVSKAHEPHLLGIEAVAEAEKAAEARLKAEEKAAKKAAKEAEEKAAAEAEKAKGLPQNAKASKKGGAVAKNARKELEAKTGKSVVTGDNFLPPAPEKKKLK